MNDFLLLLRGGNERMSLFSPEEMQQHMQEYFAWTNKLRSNGSLKDAAPLEAKGMVLTSENGRIITDRPLAESKEVVGGYFLITADDIQHATKIAEECPILSVGGEVEVRKIRPM